MGETALITPELKTKLAGIVPMHGWCTVEKAEALAESVLDIKPDTVVEIGVFGGRSLAAFGMALMHNCRGYVYGIDPWTKVSATEGNVGEENAEWWRSLDIDGIHEHCMHFMAHFQICRRVRIVAVPSEYCHGAFRSIDILHIDGNHSEEASCRDVELYAPKVRDGGYIWFDDTDWKTTHKALDLLTILATPIKSVGSCTLYQKT